MAVGAYGNDVSGGYSGYVQVHSHIGNYWEQVGEGIDGEIADDYLGISIAISSDRKTVAVNDY